MLAQPAIEYHQPFALREGYACLRCRAGDSSRPTVVELVGAVLTGLVRQPEMSADDVCDFLALMDAHGIRVWLDGGWGVDGCLGSQTRRHSDLDIVIEEQDVQRVITALQRLGYGPVPRGDTRPWNFVLGDDAGRQIDFHVVVLDEGGRGMYGPRENQDYYPAAALAGKGTVKERAVDCITPEWLVRFHTGYEVDATDWADVSALCVRFSIPVPREYLGFDDER